MSFYSGGFARRATWNFTKQFNVAEVLKEKPVYREGKGSKCARLQLVVTTCYAVLNWVEHKADRDKLDLPDDKWWQQVEEKARVLKEVLEQNFSIDDSGSGGGPGDKSAPSTAESRKSKDVEVGKAKGNRVKITRYREKTKDEKPGDGLSARLTKMLAGVPSLRKNSSSAPSRK